MHQGPVIPYIILVNAKPVGGLWQLMILLYTTMAALPRAVERTVAKAGNVLENLGKETEAALT